MTRIKFIDHDIQAHAGRIGTQPNWCKQRRRILTALLNQRTIALTDNVPDLYDLLAEAVEQGELPMDAAQAKCILDNILGGIWRRQEQSDIVRRVAIRMLCQTLLVRPVIGTDGRLIMEPDNTLPVTRDLARGRELAQIHAAGVRFGGEGIRGNKPTPAPYGYIRKGNQVIPDPETAPAIETLFHLIVKYATPKVPWSEIAQELNELGYSRRDGGDWQGDDVREMTRVPTYAGYVVDKKRLSWF